MTESCRSEVTIRCNLPEGHRGRHEILHGRIFWNSEEEKKPITATKPDRTVSMVLEKAKRKRESEEE